MKALALALMVLVLSTSTQAAEPQFEVVRDAKGVSYMLNGLYYPAADHKLSISRDPRNNYWMTASDSGNRVTIILTQEGFDVVKKIVALYEAEGHYRIVLDTPFNYVSTTDMIRTRIQTEFDSNSSAVSKHLTKLHVQKLNSHIQIRGQFMQHGITIHMLEMKRVLDTMNKF